MSTPPVVRIAMFLTGLSAATGALGLVLGWRRLPTLSLPLLAFAVTSVVLLAIATRLMSEDRWQGAALGVAWFGWYAVVAIMRPGVLAVRQVVMVVSVILCAIAWRELWIRRGARGPA